MPSTMMESPRARRVKLYKLFGGDQWEDKGTGHIECIFSEALGGLALVVKSELDGQTLLETKIYSDDIYSREQDTLIIWKDPENGDDLALSFLEADGCVEIWEKICQLHAKEDYDLLHADEPAVPLPPANLNNIDNILLVVTDVPLARRAELVKALQTDDYIRKLLDLFDVCEDLENDAGLSKLFRIFKNLMLMNDRQLLETLLSPDYIMGIMGPLEYDPDLSTRMKHREYLQSVVVFTQLVPFRNPEVLGKIHQTFQMQYIKDVALARIVDDFTFATLNSLISYNNVDIVSSIQSDEEFLEQFFDKLRKPDLPIPETRDFLSFLMELCTLARNLSPATRPGFYKTLVEHGLLVVIERTLGLPDVQCRFLSAELLNNTLMNVGLLLRSHLRSPTQVKERYPLLQQTVLRLTSDPDSGVQVQTAGLLRSLLDPESMDTTEKTEMLNIFYSDFVGQLIPPLMAPPGREDELRLSKSNICELLAFCVTSHGYRAKYFILGQNIIAKVLTLLDSKDKHLVLAVIRFFRAIIGTEDDFYYRQIIQHNLFDPIIKLFFSNGSRYNLLNSAILDTFDYIRKQRKISLISYIVAKYGDQLKTVTYVDTFGMIISQEQQHREGLDQPTDREEETSPRPSKKTLLETEEEAYFNESDEDEESPRAVLKSLASYQDETDPAEETQSPFRPRALHSVEVDAAEEDNFFARLPRRTSGEGGKGEHITIKKVNGSPTPRKRSLQPNDETETKRRRTLEASASD